MTFQIWTQYPNPTLAQLGLTCDHFAGPRRLSDVDLKAIVVRWLTVQAGINGPVAQQFYSSNWTWSDRVEAWITMQSQECQIQQLQRSLARATAPTSRVTGPLKAAGSLGSQQAYPAVVGAVLLGVLGAMSWSRSTT